MQYVSLRQILEARDTRVSLQQKLIKQYHKTLICFTMNIPGPIKTSPAIERAFCTGCTLLNKRFVPEAILHREISFHCTGCQALYVIALDAISVKQICVDIEDNSPLGRLFDMDVLTPDGHKLCRNDIDKPERSCMICGISGKGCASRRIHSVTDLQSATQQIIDSHFAKSDAEQIASLAVRSLLDEARTTPKPGLVDKNNQGSHHDMTLSTFEASALSLYPHFTHCVEIGQLTAHSSYQTTFSKLQQEGIAAEQSMYRTTNGVNTHKGAIYIIGILCGALGRLWNADHPIPPIDKLLDICSLLTQDAVKEAFSKMEHLVDPCTHGEQIYLSYGLTGIRGEVASGLSTVRNIGLPNYINALERGLSPNDAGSITLLHLISNTHDTNLYHRGGIAGYQFASTSAQKLLKEFPFPSADQIKLLDDKFIANNLSPGGCADLLSATYFLHALSNNFHHY